MSDIVARQALSRMHMREQLIAKEHQAGFATDMAMMARAVPEEAQQKFMNETRLELCEAYGFGRPTQSKPFAFAHGVAIIPVHGSLINRFGWSYSFVTGYNFIRAQHNAALLDDDVKVIIHDHNSFGGEAAGCFELSDEIYASRGTKPIIAVVDSNCYSASFALATACDKIFAIPSAGVGSVGVVSMHVDMSAALEKYGVKVTFIYSGDHKVDGNPYEELSAEVKADIQKNVDKSRAKFVAVVARNLGLDAKIIYDTEARTYRADDALKLGLIHKVAVPSAALQMAIDGDLDEEEEVPPQNPDDDEDEQAAKLSTQTTNEELTMDPNKEGNNTPAAGQPAAAVNQDAAKAERARVQGILACAEAEGRGDMANHLAFNTSMSVDEAKGLLAVAPKAAATTTTTTPAATGTTTFEQAMNNTAHPNVGADNAGAPAAGGDGKQSPEQAAAAIYADFAAMTGRKVEK
jgi:signal peptide peptidase SppA